MFKKIFSAAVILGKDTVGLIDAQGNVKTFKNLHNGVISCVRLHDNYLATGSYDKLVKVWSLNENGPEKCLVQVSLPKKVKRIVEINGQYLASDKHGDIYEITTSDIQSGNLEVIKKNIPKSSNLAIPKFMERYNILNRDIIILGDDYSKIKVKQFSIEKVYNALNMDEILNVLIPLEGFLKQIIEINGTLYFLFRVKDEDNSDSHFKIFQLAKNEIFNDQAPFQMIFPTNQTQHEQSRSDKIRIISIQGKLHIVVQHQQSIIVREVETNQIKFESNNSVLTDVYSFEDAFIIVGQQNGDTTAHTLKKNEQIRIEGSTLSLIQ